MLSSILSQSFSISVCSFSKVEYIYCSFSKVQYIKDLKNAFSMTINAFLLQVLQFQARESGSEHLYSSEMGNADSNSATGRYLFNQHP